MAVNEEQPADGAAGAEDGPEAPERAAAAAPSADGGAADPHRALVPVATPDGLDGGPAPGEPSFSVVTVERDDDIPSICGKIDTAKHLRVVLVAPRGNAVMERELLGARLVRRHADRTGREIALITRNRRLAQRARGERIPVMASLDGRPVGAFRIAVGGRQVTLPQTRRLVGGVVGAVAAAAGLLAALAYFPTATVTAYPTMRAVSQPVEVVAGRNVSAVDAAQRQVPAERVQRQVSYTFVVPATGRVRVGVTPAAGKVLLFNRTDAPQTVPAGTVVRTASGVRFLTTASVSLPAGTDQTAEAPIVAAEPGSAGNVPAGAITVIDGFPNGEVTVANLEATGGGQDREVAAVTQEDASALRVMVFPVLREIGWQELVREYQGSAYVPREAVAVLGLGPESSNARVGEAAEYATLHVEATVQALVIHHQHLEELAAAVLGPVLGEDEMLAPGTVDVRVLSVSGYNGSDDTVTVQVMAQGQAMRRVSVEQLKEEIAWTRPATAAERVQAATGSDRPADVRVEPGWMPLLPRATGRITLRFHVEGG